MNICVYFFLLDFLVSNFEVTFNTCIVEGFYLPAIFP